MDGALRFRHARMFFTRISHAITEAELLGGSNKCPNASLPLVIIFTTQAHPEFSDGFIRAVIGFAKYSRETSMQPSWPVWIGIGSVFAQWALTFSRR